ncbi:MAG: hypothetical protein GVY09_06685 [Gammaproteobacteria bacterium]|jgi:hypothetical protein|nr:hypothetical protein [Gammaproteobacteria bacterium]
MTLSFVLVSQPASATPIPVVTTTVTIPSGSNNVDTGPFTDDVFLQDMTFDGGARLSSPSSFSPVRRFRLLSGRQNMNAEWGDDDDGSDGDDNPFVKAGFDPENQETEDPSIQDAALLRTFNTLSLTEMSDGEQGDFSFRVLFQNGLRDNDPSVLDKVPEMVFFERDGNDSGMSVKVITGGTFDNPTFSNSLSMDSSDWSKTGLDVNTTEIPNPQTLHAAGFDLNAFELGPGQTAFGYQMDVVNAGPDLNGFFLTAEDPGQFLDPLDASAPSPLALLLGPVVFAAASGWLAERRRRDPSRTQAGSIGGANKGARGGTRSDGAQA